MSINELKEKEKEMKRNYIIESAQKLFSTKDYNEVSMNNIAEEVGVNKATLYYYFKNKEALYFAIVLRGVHILKDIVEKEIEKGKTGYEKFLCFGNAMYKFYAKYPDFRRMLYPKKPTKFDLVNMAGCEEYKEVMGILKELMIISCDTLQIGVEDGTVRKDVDPLKTAILVSLIHEGMSNMNPLYKNLLKDSGIDEQEFTKDVKDLIHHMIMNK